MRPCPLSALRIGARFEVNGLPGTTYELLKLGSCSALVRDRARVSVDAFDAAGEAVDGFTRTGKTTRISLATSVLELEGDA